MKKKQDKNKNNICVKRKAQKEIYQQLGQKIFGVDHEYICMGYELNFRKNMEFTKTGRILWYYLDSSLIQIF